MKWRLRTKLLLAVGSMMILAFVVMTALYVRYVQRGYLEALKWVAHAPAQYLTSALLNVPSQEEPQMKSQLAALIQQCSALYQLQDNRMTYLALLDGTGKILAHSQPEQNDQALSPKLVPYLKHRENPPILAGTIYHILIPVFRSPEEYLATIAVGFSQQAVQQQVRGILGQSMWVFIGILILTFVGMSVVLHLLVTRPIAKLAAVGHQLAAGQRVQTFQIAGWDDEISALGRAFHRMASYLHQVADVATSISTGILQGEVQPRSEQDVLGNALHKMLAYLKHVAQLATRVAEGDLTETVPMRSNDDTFGKAIQTMMTGLRVLIEQIRRSAEQMTTTGEAISSLSTHDNDVIRNVYNSVENMAAAMQTLSESVHTVVEDMQTLSASVQESSDSVLLITSSITLVASNAEELTTRGRMTIEALRNAVQGLEEVMKNTDESARLSQLTIHDALAGQQAFDQVMQSMTTIQQTITTAVESITVFAQRSREIDTILEVIHEITERTTLLALNAAIIAAQAGVHGRGFAVVAEEIKSLADGVNVSTKDIGAIVHALQQDTNKVVQTIHEGAANVRQGMERTQLAQETLHKIIDSAQQSSSVASQIAAALHEVTLTARHVANAMQEVGAMTEDFTNVTSEQELSTEQINKAIMNITSMTSQVFEETTQQLAGIQDMLNVTQQIRALTKQSLESSQQITTTVQALSEQAAVLLRSVDRFMLP